ncbi:lasso peptide biosynthesis B2 protein [Rubidibacter lacunae]
MSVELINLSLKPREYLKGLTTIVIAYLAVNLLSLERIGALLRKFKRSSCQELNTCEAEIIWAAIHKSSLYFPGRVACLELSLAFTIYALISKRSSIWCVGVAVDPIRAHAWVEVEQKPFHEKNDLYLYFKKILVV